MDMLRQKVHSSSAFERFGSHLLLRVIAIIVGGGTVVALLHRNGYEASALIALAIVLAASLYGASRLRGKGETSAGYKHRVGYREPGHKGE